jgi:uncharacterized protein YqgQ
MFITPMPHMCIHTESITIIPTITYYWTQSKWQVLGVEFEVDGAGGWLWNHGTICYIEEKCYMFGIMGLYVKLKRNVTCLESRDYMLHWREMLHVWNHGTICYIEERCYMFGIMGLYVTLKRDVTCLESWDYMLHVWNHGSICYTEEKCYMCGITRYSNKIQARNRSLCCCT